MIRTLTAVLIASALVAQTRPNAEAALTQKLASPFLKQAPWVTDYDEALEAAVKQRRLVLGYFTTANY